MSLSQSTLYRQQKSCGGRSRALVALLVRVRDCVMRTQYEGVEWAWHRAKNAAKNSLFLQHQAICYSILLIVVVFAAAFGASCELLASDVVSGSSLDSF